MKFFNSIKKTSENVGIYHHQAFGNQSVNLKNFIIFTPLGLNIILSAAFFMFEAHTFGDYFECFYSTATLVVVTVILEELVRNQFNINELITKLEKTIQKRSENPSSKLMYEKMSEKIENRFEILSKLINISLPGVMIPNMIVSFFIYFSTDLSNDAFRLAFPIWLPFEWRTLFGYLIPFSIQFVAFHCIFQIVECNYNFIIGSCETLQSLSVDIKNDVYVLDDLNKIGAKPAEIKRKICEFVELLLNARQFARDFSDIESIIITVSFLWSISTICSSLLMIQMELSSGSLFELIRPLIALAWSFLSFFIICNFGEQVTNQLNEITDGISECEWYSFPIEGQKMFLTIMAATQRPVIFRGFATIMATRDTFKKVANGGFSYFTILRQFNE